MTTSGAFLEYKIVRWLREFDRPMFDSYSERLGELGKVFGDLPDVHWIGGPNQQVGFRMAMETPAHLVLSREISRFMTDKRYRIFREEQSFTTKFGQIP